MAHELTLSLFVQGPDSAMSYIQYLASILSVTLWSKMAAEVRAIISHSRHAVGRGKGQVLPLSRIKAWLSKYIHPEKAGKALGKRDSICFICALDLAQGRAH